MCTLSKRKQTCRMELSRLRQQLSVAQRTDASTTIFLRLMDFISSLSPRRKPEQLLVYKALPFEVDTSRVFAMQGVQVFSPRMLADNQLEWVAVNHETVWKPSSFGVHEPEGDTLWHPSSKITMLICPLLGFDYSGNRLGMGKGFFDRWLEKYGVALSMQIGLAFSCQRLAKVPMEPHDAPLSVIITELEVISCRTS